jgi:hypothetical protein
MDCAHERQRSRTLHEQVGFLKEVGIRPDKTAVDTVRPVDVVIGIITWQSRQMLQDLLDSILREPPACSFEIMVVDNASTDGTADLIRSEYPSIRLVENAENQGVAPARNTIFKAASARYVLMLDVDTSVPEGAIDALVNVMDEHPNAAIGGPKLVYEDGSLQYSCRPFPGILNIVIEGTFLKEWLPNSKYVRNYTMQDWDHDDLMGVDWMYGAALIFRMESLKEVGFFDERFFYLYEDVDLCFRAKRRGFDVLYIPRSTIVHFLRREQKGLFHPRIGSHVKSITRYLLKDRYGLLN